LGENPSLVIAQDLVRGAGAFFGSALHVALEVDRAMLTGEMALAVREWLACLLVAAELGVLAHFPEGIGAEQIGVAEGIVHGCPAVPERCDAREHPLELSQ